jgi:hypothetical protein
LKSRDSGQEGRKGLAVKVTGEGDVHEMKDGWCEINDTMAVIQIRASQVEKGIRIGMHAGEFTFPEERLLAHRTFYIIPRQSVEYEIRCPVEIGTGENLFLTKNLFYDWSRRSRRITYPHETFCQLLP